MKGGPIAPGDTFTRKDGRCVHTYRREADDLSAHVSERIRITHLSNSDDAKHVPYTFGTEAEWFLQRGMTHAC